MNWPQSPLGDLGIDIDVKKPLGNYSVAIQQMVAITRSLEAHSARVLILDEPTSSLDAHETKQLFDVIKKLKAEGIGIVFITHFLDQVYEITDRITVLRNGKFVGTFETASLPRVQLIANMLGRSLTDLDDLSKRKIKSENWLKAYRFWKPWNWGRLTTWTHQYEFDE